MNSPKKLEVKPALSCEEPLHFASPNFSVKVLGGLKNLRVNGLLCDYTLSADQVSIPVHRAVMAACSDYFRIMLTGNMRESKEDKVQLLGLTANGLEAVVEFAYSGSLQLNMETVQEILAAAHHLQMSEAVDMCCQFLQTGISISNCVDLKNLTELYSLEDAHNSIHQFILENFELFSECDQYFKLTHTQLKCLLQENRLKVISEFRLFELVLKWLHYDISEREQYTAELMQHVRLPLLSGEELVEKVSRVEIMIRNKECFELLNEAKDYHIVTSKRPMLQTNRTQVRSDKKSIVMCHAENFECFHLKDRRHAFLKDTIVPVYNPSVSVVDNFMYVCGGKYDTNENNEIATARCFRYDPHFDSWFEIASMNEARKDFVLVSFNKQLFAIGGQDESTVLCSVECYSITNNEWDVKTSLNSGIFSSAGTPCQQLVYIAGGIDSIGFSQRLTRYDPQNDIWDNKCSMFQARANHVMECVGECLYALGGNMADTYNFAIPVTSIECYKTTTNQWTVCRSLINVREAGSCVIDKKIFIVGGIDGEHYFSDLIIEYCPEKDSTKLVERFAARIHGKACCVLTLPQCM